MNSSSGGQMRSLGHAQTGARKTNACTMTRRAREWSQAAWIKRKSTDDKSFAPSLRPELRASVCFAWAVCPLFHFLVPSFALLAYWWAENDVWFCSPFNFAKPCRKSRKSLAFLSKLLVDFCFFHWEKAASLLFQVAACSKLSSSVYFRLSSQANEKKPEKPTITAGFLIKFVDFFSRSFPNWRFLCVPDLRACEGAYLQ